MGAGGPVGAVVGGGAATAPSGVSVAGPDMAVAVVRAAVAAERMPWLCVLVVVDAEEGEIVMDDISESDILARAAKTIFQSGY